MWWELREHYCSNGCSYFVYLWAIIWLCILVEVLLPMAVAAAISCANTLSQRIQIATFVTLICSQRLRIDVGAWTPSNTTAYGRTSIGALSQEFMFCKPRAPVRILELRFSHPLNKLPGFFAGNLSAHQRSYGGSSKSADKSRWSCWEIAEFI